jgi:hypothetical protein
MVSAARGTARLTKYNSSDKQMIRLDDINGKNTDSWHAQARSLLQARAPVRWEEKKEGDRKVPILRTRSWKQFFLELFVPGKKTEAISRTYTAINEQVKPKLSAHHTEPDYQNSVLQPKQEMAVVEDDDELLCQLQEKAGLPDTSAKNLKSSPYRPLVGPGCRHVENATSEQRREHFKKVYIETINKSVVADAGLAVPVIVPFFDKSRGTPGCDGKTIMKHSISKENVNGLADAIKEAKTEWAKAGRLIEPVILSTDKAVTSMATKKKIRIRH